MEVSETDAYEFARVCISQLPEAVRRRRLQSLIEGGLDWEAVCREAGRHGIRPLIFRNLEHLLGPQLPSWLQDWIQEHQQKNRIRTNFLVRELGEIRRLCEEHDLPLLALKGPVLAKVAYGDIAMRQYVDLDVLVPSDRFSEFDQLLRDMGYEYPKQRKKIEGWRRALFRSLKGQWQYARAGGAFNLDVHTRVMPPGYAFPADFNPLWERSREIQLSENVTVPGLAPEDAALVLSYHGVKNYWRSLRYVADLAQLVQAEPTLDWSASVTRARQMQGTRVLKLGLLLAHDVLDMALPADVESWVRSASGGIQSWGRDVPMDGVRVMLANYLRDRSQQTVLSLVKRIRLQLATKSTLASKIRYGAYSTMQHLWSTLLKP